MNFTNRTTHFLSFWILAVCALIGFGLVDLGIIAFADMAVSLSQIAAVVFAFALISGGALFTVWRFESR